jgi:squalene-hopene/tetraprenyl-beta-curcumene cyclase
MNSKSTSRPLSRRGFLAASTAIASFSATGLLSLGSLQAAVMADPKIDALVVKAVEYLAKHQSADGAFTPQAGVGVTALVATALLQNGRSPDDPLVARSLKFLEGYVQPDGGIYSPKLGYKNYETCIALTCFVEANADKRYEKFIRNAEKYLKATQWTEAENENDPARKMDKSDPFYGGAGYGKNKRPDLSNTAFLIDALKEAGNGPDDESMKKALVFVSRCQNLESEYNNTPAAAKNPDGGFYYTPADGGESAADKLPNGGLRSYASMTYSGLKSMLYCGAKADDPRVKAATKWIQENYDLKTNPGLGPDGLYYYYHVFAKALAAVGGDTLQDAKGVKHAWRKELVAELASRQLANGSWTNTKSRWLEGDPNLVTGYALLALSYCRPGAK